MQSVHEMTNKTHSNVEVPGMAVEAHLLSRFFLNNFFQFYLNIYIPLIPFILNSIIFIPNIYNSTHITTNHS